MEITWSRLLSIISSPVIGGELPALSWDILDDPLGGGAFGVRVDKVRGWPKKKYGAIGQGGTARQRGWEGLV